MIVLIDNYDSFSYNLVQMIGSIEPDIQVVRNDQVTADDIENMKPSHLILSPGPGYPRDAGILEEAVMKLKGKMPILGVCLGHQGICEAFGGTIAHAKKLMHGKQSDIRLDSHIQDGRFPASEKAGIRCRLFEGLPPVIPAARYHSLSAVPDSLPEELEVVALDCMEGEVMAVQHMGYPIYGLQFHPESILTPDGRRILENFLNIRTTQAM
mgnify:FL=1